jgi:Ca2+-binding EF-hand superfamily protein
MRTYCILFLALVIFGTVSIVYSAGPSDETFRGAYKQILSQADTNKDGKLSLTECKAIYKDKAMAEKNCTFWDVDHDGVITEDEYVQQAWSMGKKKK